MTPEDVTAELADLFPFFFRDQARAVSRFKLYSDHLASAAGERLAIAYRATMGAWTDTTPPMPAHILKNLPPVDVPAVEEEGPMTVDDVLRKLGILFKTTFSDPAKAAELAGIYRGALSTIDGERMAEAYRRTMAAWVWKEPPMPGNLLANMPSAPHRREVDPNEPLHDDAVSKIMETLVPSEPGRQIVNEGLVLFLEELVRKRLITTPDQIDAAGIERLTKARAEFEAAQSRIDPNGFMASQLRSMAQTLREKAERSTAKWSAFLTPLPGE